MAVTWTRHRFSGGVLALDVVNTVVHPDDPALRFDRFADQAEIPRFAEAASVYCAGELGGRPLTAPEPGRIAGPVLTLREATDRLFRRSAREGTTRADELAALLTACGMALAGQNEELTERAPYGDPSRPLRLEAAIALSALSLVAPERRRRVRICRNCAWLFLDRSRNASRLWCDMAVCGNRQKARRHYRRRAAAREEAHA